MQVTWKQSTQPLLTFASDVCNTSELPFSATIDVRLCQETITKLSCLLHQSLLLGVLQLT